MSLRSRTLAIAAFVMVMGADAGVRDLFAQLSLEMQPAVENSGGAGALFREMGGDPVTPERLTARSRIQQLVDGAEMTVEDEPLTLLQAVERRTTGVSRVEVVRAYWATTARLLEWQATVRCAEELESLAPDRVIARSILLAAENDRDAAELAYREASLELAALLPTSTSVATASSVPTPRPTTPPHTRSYKTELDTITRGRVVAPRAILLDRTLPVRHSIIEQRNEACEAADIYVQEAIGSYRRGQNAALFQQFAWAVQARRDQELAFIKALMQYNADILGYVNEVVSGSVSDRAFVGTLVRLAPASASETTDSASPGQNMGTPSVSGEEADGSGDGVVRSTPIGARAGADSLVAPASFIGQGPSDAAAKPLTIGLPGDDGSRPRVLPRDEATPIPTEQPASFGHGLPGPGDRPVRESPTNSGTEGLFTETPDRDAMVYRVAYQAPAAPSGGLSVGVPDDAAPLDRETAYAKQVADFYFAPDKMPHVFPSLYEAEAITLERCLALAGPTRRAEAIEAYWRCASALATRSFLMHDALDWHDWCDENPVAPSLRSPMELPLVMTAASTHAESLEARIRLFETQADLTVLLSRPLSQAWYVPSSPPRVTSLDMTATSSTWQSPTWQTSPAFLRAVGLGPDAYALMLEQASGLSELEAASGIAFVSYKEGLTRPEEVVEIFSARRRFAEDFFRSVGRHNQLVADYVLSTRSDLATADQLADVLLD